MYTAPALQTIPQQNKSRQHDKAGDASQAVAKVSVMERFSTFFWFSEWLAAKASVYYTPT